MSHHNHQPKLTHRTQSGFTMVELSITLAFLALLLISIAVITTNIIAIYQKGMTLKAVNSVGRGLVEELTTAINTAPSVDTTSLCNSLAGDDAAACRSDNAFKYVYQANYNSAGQQYNGVFCTGYYSYIWNTYYGVDSGNTLSLRYLSNTDGSTPTIDAPRLIRVEDRTYRVCSAVMVPDSYTSTFASTSSATIDITKLAGSTNVTNPIHAYYNAHIRAAGTSGLYITENVNGTLANRISENAVIVDLRPNQVSQGDAQNGFVGTSQLAEITDINTLITKAAEYDFTVDAAGTANGMTIVYIKSAQIRALSYEVDFVVERDGETGRILFHAL